jgi:hypothetical protein
MILRCVRAGDLYEEGSDRHFPMMVRLAPRYRQDLDAIRDITVGAQGPNGQIQVPLSEVATVKLTSGAAFIYREQQQRYIPVPAAPDVTGYTKEPLNASPASAGSGKGQGQRFVQELDIPGQWWATFHSRPLNDLIGDALKHNPDLQAAQAALRAAHELVHQACDKTRDAAQHDLFADIEGYYNRQRLHSALLYITPGQAERQAAQSCVH